MRALRSMRFRVIQAVAWTIVGVIAVASGSQFGYLMIVLAVVYALRFIVWPSVLASRLE